MVSHSWSLRMSKVKLPPFLAAQAHSATLLMLLCSWWSMGEVGILQALVMKQVAKFSSPEEQVRFLVGIEDAVK